MKNQKLFLLLRLLKTGGEKKFQKSGAVSKKNSQHTQLLCLVRWIAMQKIHTILRLLVPKLTLPSQYFSKK
jgi:hypothetical protein